MNRIRVADLAKDLQMSVAELVSVLVDLGVEVEGADSQIDISTAQAVRAVLDKGHPEVELPPTMTVRELAQALGVQTTQVQQKLMRLGVLAALNQQLSADQIERVAYELGYSVRWTQAKEPEVPESARPRTASTGGPQPRPPVVTILGHVDHGKTTLLDAIRRTNVAEGEYGGITQHIGAYQVEVEHAGERAKITFLDTPGHEAFTAMRARGAQVTDIAVLVVAADDGVMPQTVEALNHAKAAGVPIIVAINKIDKPEANPDRVKQQLAELGVVPEEWGGDTIFVPVSAKQRIGLGDLLEAILLVAEVQELKADPNAPAQGVVIESKLDKGRGPVATIIVQQGTFKQGDAVVAGEAHGCIRALLDDRGNRVLKATPSMPVEVIGLSAVPTAGEKMEVVKNERIAKQIAMEREQRHRQEKLASQRTRVTMRDLNRLIREGEIKELLIVLKADVHGSVEAVRTSLERLEHPEVRLRVLHAAVGNITESDIMLASASNALVIGFNVRVEPEAQRAAEQEHVEVRTYRIIYELVEDVKAAMLGMLQPVIEEFTLGKAEVRAVFSLPRGTVAGCYVTEGKMVRNAEVRVWRKKEVVFTGKLSSLRHLKEDVREIAQGYECGIMLEGFSDFREGDVIECFEKREVSRTGQAVAQRSAAAVS
ncbi:MAG: translation initiation factor IF-2 [Armatimonadota bacterium]|nr:translation initiation factor IF-2 [bacterium]MCS7309504.1 translation initiation factor IF-2 [Armatimonadota bacterium]MDW8290053.1 translation initiation factor IF-2 [Armatimonadota bacterium]